MENELTPNKRPDDELFFVFDVESIGLHGPAFAWGFVVVNGNGDELGQGYGAMPYAVMNVADDNPDLIWVKENVLPALYGVSTETFVGLVNKFWDNWLQWKERGALMVSDCAWPVETNFLQAVMGSVESARADGPYPLLDVSSVLLAKGKDPVGTFDRKVGEMPAHNPLCDARQSARVLIETLGKVSK